MISRISGRLRETRPNSLLVEVNGISYDIFIPPGIMEAVINSVDSQGKIELVIFHYLQTTQTKALPVLIGFLNEIEREFFEKFITVSGIGPRAAVKAMTVSISTIAEAIDAGNSSLLQSLPGIGSQRTRELMAKLQGKVGKYGLIQDTSGGAPAKIIPEDMSREAEAVLIQLQYSQKEAKKMIESALERNPHLATAEEILNEVYRQRKQDSGRE